MIDTQQLLDNYKATRYQSIAACEPLFVEDYSLQAEGFTSPPKWHLAHTSWFFETFILKPFVSNYCVYDEMYEVLFNSYYNGVGEQFSRPKRGLLSRPSVDEVRVYRNHVDEAMATLLMQTDHVDYAQIYQRCILGLEHEKQHQELFYTDLKYSFSINPKLPIYTDKILPNTGLPAELSWSHFNGGLIDVGCDASPDHFSFDNENPQHKVFLEPFELANRLVTNGEFQAFIDDGGYQRAEFWLADGWSVVQEQQWQQPLYWSNTPETLGIYTLHGLKPRYEHAPVCHISGYEADAYARWAGARLPTEAEWEHAAKSRTLQDEQHSHLHPRSASTELGLQQMYGECWQWTGSAYRPYPGFDIAEGAIGEYNGKFMCNQWVLRGSSCVTSEAHTRASYRNFFYPQDRWQFSGLRLAKNVK